MRHLTVTARAFLTQAAAHVQLSNAAIEHLINSTPTSALRVEYTEVNILLGESIARMEKIDRILKLEAEQRVRDN